MNILKWDINISSDYIDCQSIFSYIVIIITNYLVEFRVSYYNIFKIYLKKTEIYIYIYLLNIWTCSFIKFRNIEREKDRYLTIFNSFFPLQLSLKLISRK